MQKVPPPPMVAMFFQQIKISQTIFEKGHPRNIRMKLFPNLGQGFQSKRFFKNFFISLRCKKSPPMVAMFFQQIKISQTIFEKGHPRKIPVKLSINSLDHPRKIPVKLFIKSLGHPRKISEVHTEKKASPYSGHVFRRINIS